MKNGLGKSPHTLSAKGLRFGIIVSRFNEEITRGLLSGAVTELERLGVKEDDLTVVWVPGSFEIPWTAQRLSGGGFDALICLGALIRGETDHYRYLASAVSYGIARVALDQDLPVAFGVLTTQNTRQALHRSAPGENNKGAEAAAAAVEMAQMARRHPAARSRCDAAEGRYSHGKPTKSS